MKGRAASNEPESLRAASGTPDFRCLNCRAYVSLYLALGLTPHCLYAVPGIDSVSSITGQQLTPGGSRPVSRGGRDEHDQQGCTVNSGGRSGRNMMAVRALAGLAAFSILAGILVSAVALPIAGVVGIPARDP